MPSTDLQKVSAIKSILDVTCRVTGTRTALITQMIGDHWTICAIHDELNTGMTAGDTLPNQITPCSEVRERQQLVAINDLTADPVHACNPVLVAGKFESYISAPIILLDGTFFGTLCALDRRPAKLDTSDIAGMFRLFTGLVADQINTADLTAVSAAHLHETNIRLGSSETDLKSAEVKLAVSAANLKEVSSQLAISDAALLDAQATARLREQFVAILGHDLRNPIAAITSGVQLLRRQALDDKGRMIVTMMDSSAARLLELVQNMLDFAMTQLGGGIAVICKPVDDIVTVLNHIVSEVAAKNPHRLIEADFNLPASVNCDPGRIGQLLSNLLANAVTHGASSEPVRVSASLYDDVFQLSVTNGGKEIPPEAMANLFKPFVRGNAKSREGLGLGLYIAAAIAHAHRGTLIADSNPQKTQFILKMPSETSESIALPQQRQRG